MRHDSPLATAGYRLEPLKEIGIAVDAVIFTVRDGKLHALLIQIKNGLYAGRWAFPGGLVEPRETTAAAARRILERQTGVSGAYLEQLRAFDDPDRDGARRVVSIAHFALVPDDGAPPKTTEKYLDVRWWPVDRLPPLAYDHSAMAKAAVKRLRAQLMHTNVVWSLLPTSFTLTELQNVYERILERPLDKRNFRKKILALGLLKETGKKTTGGTHRPAALYRFKKRELTEVEIL